MRSYRQLYFPIVLATVIGAFSATATTTAPKFYGDDPLVREPASQDASGAENSEIGDFYEMVHNLFVTPGYQPSGRRAQNINTVDEVPDSEWFTNRVGARPIPEAELVRGPNVGAPPDPS